MTVFDGSFQVFAFSQGYLFKNHTHVDLAFLVTLIFVSPFPYIVREKLLTSPLATPVFHVERVRHEQCRVYR